MFVLTILLTLLLLLALSSESFPEKGKKCLYKEARKRIINQVLGKAVALAKARKKGVSKENWTKFQKKRTAVCEIGNKEVKTISEVKEKIRHRKTAYILYKVTTLTTWFPLISTQTPFFISPWSFVSRQGWAFCHKP